MSFRNTNKVLRAHNCQLRWRDSKREKITVFRITVFRSQTDGDYIRTLAIGLFRTDELHLGLADPTMRRPSGFGGNGKTGWEDHSYCDNGMDYTTPAFTPQQLKEVLDALTLDKLSWK